MSPASGGGGVRGVVLEPGVVVVAAAAAMVAETGWLAIALSRCFVLCKVSLGLANLPFPFIQHSIPPFVSFASIAYFLPFTS